MASEQFSLCWDNFHKNMSSGMNSLLENEDLVDVTLAVEGKCLKAHKMVLSVCSPYFKELFKSNPCQHPIVFMKDVSYVALSDLLQFMYQGEVQVSQENLTTFIKTAEALQIKGLTGDGNGTTDSDAVESLPDDKHTTNISHIEEYKTVPRPKKQHPVPVVTATPAAKRPRLSSSSASVTESPLLTQQITKTEPSISNAPTGSSNTEMVQFKMEPYDQSQTINIPDDPNPDDTFGDETLDDTNVDDTEDYSMEGAEEEPQAGTSTDGAGEGQDEKKHYGGIVIDGFTYHHNTVRKKRVRYLICSEYKRLCCKARAVVPEDGAGKEFVLRKAHNHPPLLEASAKRAFVRELKKSINVVPEKPLREVYNDVSRSYPEGAQFLSYNNLAPSMRRWRCCTRKLRALKNNYDKNNTSEEKPRRKRITTRSKFIVDGFIYHNNVVSGSPPLRYLGCADHRRAGCRGRATLPVGGTLDQLKVTQPHNHPPDLTAAEKDKFIKELRKAALSSTMEKISLRKVYENIAELYPEGAAEVSYRSINSSLHRWRRAAQSE